MFYNSFSITIKDFPVIVYPEHGLENLIGISKESLQKYLEELYHQNNLITSGSTFHIVILWNDKDIMADIWIYKNISDWKNDPTIDVKNFRGTIQINEGGITAGDGLILLAKEEEYRRTTKNIQDYLINRIQL